MILDFVNFTKWYATYGGEFCLSLHFKNLIGYEALRRNYREGGRISQGAIHIWHFIHNVWGIFHFNLQKRIEWFVWYYFLKGILKVTFRKIFLLSSISSKKWTNKFVFSTVRQKNRIHSFVFWRNRWLEKHFQFVWPLAALENYR